jgi:CHAT domain-containing protein
LPFVQEELERVAGLYESRVLKDEEFRVANLQGELTQAPFSVVHIASHGQFKGELRDTFLLSYDGKIHLDTLEQVMGLSRYRDEPVELLTLSACQTAAGDDRAALGLAGVAIKAGAHSALASLWFINDRASALLVSEFYRRLQDPTLSKARALQQAQLTLIGEKRYRHPGYWAPFLLIGNWL